MGTGLQLGRSQALERYGTGGDYRSQLRPISKPEEGTLNDFTMKTTWMTWMTGEVGRLSLI